ncbi:hypothetical protein Trydic_g9584 [Trypoxylus dichotomus]
MTIAPRTKFSRSYLRREFVKLSTGFYDATIYPAAPLDENRGKWLTEVNKRRVFGPLKLNNDSVIRLAEMSAKGETTPTETPDRDSWRVKLRDSSRKSSKILAVRRGRQAQ